MHDSLLKISNLYLNKFIKYLSSAEIYEVFNNVNDNDTVTVYYRLNIAQRSRVFSASPKVRKIIIEYENKLLFMPYIEPAIVLNKYMSADSIESLLNEIDDMDKYIREFIIMEHNSVVCGIIYFSDIMHMFINNTYDADNIDILPAIKICKRNRNIKLFENEVTDVHKFIVVDSNNRAIGAINIDYVLSNYDLYVDTEDSRYLYVIQKKSVTHVTKVAASVFVGAVISLCLSKYFMFSGDEIFTLMLLRCVNDIIILIILEDKIQDTKFIAYISIMLGGISILCLVIVYYMYTFSLAIRSFIFINVLCIANSILLKYIHDNFANYSIFIILFLPEVMLMLYMYYSKYLF